MSAPTAYHPLSCPHRTDGDRPCPAANPHPASQRGVATVFMTVVLLFAVGTDRAVYEPLGHRRAARCRRTTCARSRRWRQPMQESISPWPICARAASISPIPSSWRLSDVDDFAVSQLPSGSVPSLLPRGLLDPPPAIPDCPATHAWLSLTGRIHDHQADPDRLPSVAAGVTTTPRCSASWSGWQPVPVDGGHDLDTAGHARRDRLAHRRCVGVQLFQRPHGMVRRQHAGPEQYRQDLHPRCGSRPPHRQP